MKHLIKREQGQSIVIITFAFIALIALLALVVDAGNAYVQRRAVQNAYDAASEAGTVALGNGMKATDISTQVSNYGAANGATYLVNGVKTPGIDPNNVWFVLQKTDGTRFYYTDSNGNKVPVKTLGAATVPVSLTVNSVLYPVVGIHAEGNQSFNTFLAQMVGITQMSTGGSSSTLAKCGACSSDDLFPILIDGTTFGSAVITEQSNPSYRYLLYENKNINQGRYRYVYWATGNSIDNELPGASNYQPSGTVFVTDTLTGNTSLTADTSIKNALQTLVTNNTYVTVPVADTGSASNTTYTVGGFTRLHVRCYKFGTSNAVGTCTQYHPTGDTNYIEATVSQWTTPSAGGGCSQYGICAVTDTSTTRKAIVTVNYNKVIMNQTPHTGHVPVDTALVLDLSSSMAWNFSGGSTINTQNPSRLSSAVKALQSYIAVAKSNKQANPTWTDQAALVVFPQDSPPTIAAYQSVCYGKKDDNNNTVGTQNLQELAQVKNDLGGGVSGDVSWLNTISTTIGTLSTRANTPTAEGIKQARITLLGTNHIAGNTPVMIIATDGRANVRVDTGWYSGNNVDDLSCNYPAVMDMTNEASIAKSYGITIFVIAISNDYASNPNLESMFPAMASADTQGNPPHFLAGATPADLTTYFTQITNRVQNLGSECTTTPRLLPANGAVITLKKQGTDGTGANFRQANVDANGQAIFTDISDGTWVIQPTQIVDPNDGFTYNVYTLGQGGMTLTDLPTIVVQPQDQTYNQAVWLSTTSELNCPH